MAIQNPWEFAHTHEDLYEDWRQEASNGDTLLGFMEWFYHSEEMNFPPDEPEPIIMTDDEVQAAMPELYHSKNTTEAK